MEFYTSEGCIGFTQSGDLCITQPPCTTLHFLHLYEEAMLAEEVDQVVIGLRVQNGRDKLALEMRYRYKMGISAGIFGFFI